jgi:hypothetical protein
MPLGLPCIPYGAETPVIIGLCCGSIPPVGPAVSMSGLPRGPPNTGPGAAIGLEESDEMI